LSWVPYLVTSCHILSCLVIVLFHEHFSPASLQDRGWGAMGNVFRFCNLNENEEGLAFVFVGQSFVSWLYWLVLFSLLRVVSCLVWSGPCLFILFYGGSLHRTLVKYTLPLSCLVFCILVFLAPSNTHASA
jgi:hypothetical protein